MEKLEDGRIPPQDSKLYALKQECIGHPAPATPCAQECATAPASLYFTVGIWFGHISRGGEIKQKTKHEKAEGVAQAVTHLPSKCEDLSSNSDTTKTVIETLKSQKF
jgi:hypothetical protein